MRLLVRCKGVVELEGFQRSDRYSLLTNRIETGDYVADNQQAVRKPIERLVATAEIERKG